jgi:hypothetical protein
MSVLEFNVFENTKPATDATTQKRIIVITGISAKTAMLFSPAQSSR